ncbi:glutamine amidotransferase [Occultella glacieicola]|uniref:Glutamine amidotransferase n=1 Tax=Occultella glacieicola TaxID=2518684 RepID=A0ABY2E7P3_9MICO|nr:glutamine amidotransferase [Occultella glacieicola]TDE95851.1 glutamine amidotransferase [Occultella glacieicola]
MRPFLLLASRAEDAAADEEYRSLLRHGALAPGELVRVRLEAGQMPPRDLTEYAGVIIGGSPFTVSDAHKSPVQRRVEADLGLIVDEVIRRDLPMLALCYGVGIVGARAGGVVDATYGEQTSAARIELTPDGVADPLLADLPTAFEAYVGHKEAVTRLPAGATVLATSATCPVQMYRLGRHGYVTQFHPEMDLASVTTRIEVYRDSGYFDAAEVAAVLDRVARADVTTAHALVRAFVHRYGNGATARADAELLAG